MKYLLDTNTCIQLLNDRTADVRRRFFSQPPGDLAVCSIVKAELLYGAWRSGRPPANLQRLETFFEPLRSLPFDDECAATYGRIRASLAMRGLSIGANDLLTAATGLTHRLIVVTHNLREFERVEGLQTEDWEVTT